MWLSVGIWIPLVSVAREEVKRTLGDYVRDLGGRFHMRGERLNTQADSRQLILDNADPQHGSHQLRTVRIQSGTASFPIFFFALKVCSSN